MGLQVSPLVFRKGNTPPHIASGERVLGSGNNQVTQPGTPGDAWYTRGVHTYVCSSRKVVHVHECRCIGALAYCSPC